MPRLRATVLAVTLLCVVSVALAQDGASPDSLTARTGIAPLPIVFYTPETGTALGAALNVFHRPAGATEEARPTTLTPLLIYSFKNQVVLVLSASHWRNDEREHFTAGISYINFPDKFYGIGNDVVDDEESEDYTTEVYSADLSYLRRVRGSLGVGVDLGAGHARLLERENGGLLESDTVPGSNGGAVLGAGVFLDQDDRNHETYPTAGGWNQLRFRWYDRAIGSDYEFRITQLESRRYLGLGGDKVLAFRGVLTHVDGAAPFQVLPALGGDQLLRGYYGGRFRDRDLSAFELEYRQLLRWRLGFVLFAGVGQVAHVPRDFALSEYHAAGGIGLRIQFLKSEKLNLRFDVGFGEDDGGTYISLGEAF